MTEHLNLLQYSAGPEISTACSPSPRPSPQGEGAPSAARRRLGMLRKVERLAKLLPLPGERAGVRGNGRRLVQTCDFCKRLILDKVSDENSCPFVSIRGCPS